MSTQDHNQVRHTASRSGNSLRIVVGTLYSGESEFSDCCESLAKQTLQPVEHFVIRNLPKHEAHTTLYREFTARASECDLFIKLDADMVIINDDFLEQVANRFERDVELDHLKVGVKDFFSNRTIGALNCYRSNCKWEEIQDAFHTDQAPVNRRRRETDQGEIGPAAHHCMNPSGFQSFHFGLHKGLKARYAQKQKSAPLVFKHWLNIELTWKHFRETDDIRLLLASAGAELALSGRLLHEDIDYRSPKAKQTYEECHQVSVRELERRVKWLRLWNRRFLPSTWRVKHVALGWKSVVPSRWHEPSGPEVEFSQRLKSGT